MTNSNDTCKPTRFIDLTYDYGFKIAFENQDRPELMIGFLNAVITDRDITIPMIALLILETQIFMFFITIFLFFKIISVCFCHNCRKLEQL